MELAFCLALMGQSQDPFEKCRLGERVELMFREGHTLRGELVTPRNEKDYDLLKSSLVALDMTFEYLRLDGQVAFEKPIVASVTKLRPLSKEERDKVLQQKRKERVALTDEDKKRIARQEQFYKEWEKEREAAQAALFESNQKESEGKEKDKEKKAKEIYIKFPEPEWGQAKYDELSKYLKPTGQASPKYIDLRKTLRTTGDTGQKYAPADEDQAEFFENFDLWKQGRDLSKKKEKAPSKSPGEGSAPK